MSSSTTSSNATASRTPSFERRMQDVKLSKSHINLLVMDYLVREGYPRAAQRFAVEANIQSDANLDSIQERVEIRNLIYAGDVETAIARINGLNEQILDRDEALHFSLMRLQLIELIRKSMANKDGDIAPALEFATTHLAPRAPTREKFLQDLEETMTLLIFDPTNLTPRLAELLHPKKRKEVADQVNEAILQSQGERTRSRLLELVRTRAWAEQRARAAKKDIPARLDVGLDGDSADGKDDSLESTPRAHRPNASRSSHPRLMPLDPPGSPFDPAISAARIASSQRLRQELANESGGLPELLDMVDRIPVEPGPATRASALPPHSPEAETPLPSSAAGSVPTSVSSTHRPYVAPPRHSESGPGNGLSIHRRSVPSPQPLLSPREIAMNSQLTYRPPNRIPPPFTPSPSPQERTMNPGNHMPPPSGPARPSAGPSSRPSRPTVQTNRLSTSPIDAARAYLPMPPSHVVPSQNPPLPPFSPARWQEPWQHPGQQSPAGLQPAGSATMQQPSAQLSASGMSLPRRQPIQPPTAGPGTNGEASSSAPSTPDAPPRSGSSVSTSAEWRLLDREQGELSRRSL